MSDTDSTAGRHPAIDELDRAIVSLSARINAATYELLVLIRRFDERGGWLAWGFECCADWLHWRCDIGLSAAREKVRAAHALKTLPATSMAFADGTLSYSKVRALTRVANADNEHDLLAFALKTTAEQVAERCRELRCGTALSTDEANRAFGRRSLNLHRNPERGTITVTVELPLEQGELIDKALDQARDAHDNENPELANESWSAQRADAFVELARAYLRNKTESRSGGRYGRGTAAAVSLAVIANASSTRITLNTGRRVARRASRISCCSATGTTVSSTKAVSRSRRIIAIAGASNGRMALPYRLAVIGQLTSPTRHLQTILIQKIPPRRDLPRDPDNAQSRTPI
jgi:Domain of unknown function (DUF222)